MAGDRTTPSKLYTRDTDDDVGTSGPAAVGGGQQTPEQAAITQTGAGGKSDADRQGSWSGQKHAPDPSTKGGSSGGHSDRKVARPDGEPQQDRDATETE